MSFEWDESKRLSTLQKHGLDFIDVVDIFEGPVLTVPSKQNDENRWLAIGISKGLELAVIYTIRNESYRIITARRARRNERKEYYQNYPERSP
ncbi:MAG: BrnT family toxin [Rhodobacteraceae bacterium]|nr:BrnT family toxin [Paracoccaceae bacterium]